MLMGLAPYGEPRYVKSIENIFGNSFKNLSIADLNIFSKRLVSLKLIKEIGFSPREENLRIFIEDTLIWLLVLNLTENIVNDLISESINKYNIWKPVIYISVVVCPSIASLIIKSVVILVINLVLLIYSRPGVMALVFWMLYHYLNEIKEVNPRDSRLVIMSGIKMIIKEYVIKKSKIPRF